LSTDAITITPLSRPPDATVQVPGSKSITNRALLLASLADGVSVLDGVLESDDTHYMAAALRQLGIEVTAEADAHRMQVRGCSGVLPLAGVDLFVGNAGTAMRFLTAAVCLGRGRYRVDGSARMRARPIQDLVDGLAALGVPIRCEPDSGCPPVVIEAQGLPGGRAHVRGDRSSQFLSALLQVAPYAARDVDVVIDGELIAQPYVDMTIAVMGQFGVAVGRDGYRSFHVRGGQRYQARRYAIEPDASSAHYFLAAAALTGGRVRIDGLGRDSLQGDVRFADLLATMGADVRWRDDSIEVTGPTQLGGLDADMNALSDTAPTMAALAPFASGPVRIRNIAHVRLQESDRLTAVTTELRRLGVRVEERSDGLTIHPSPITPAAVDTYDDHRIAMSFALIGLKVPGIQIRDPGCVTKTFPDFFARLETLRR
jgi:3-phosphoshikimate 1-carboxyvinyltransferase